MIKPLLASLLVLSAGYAQDEDNWQPEWVEYQDSENYESPKTNSFRYGSAGVYLPLPLPTIGIGYRIKDKDQAFDLSVNVATIFVASSVESHIKGLKYINERDYWGVGTSFGFSYGGAYFDYAFVSHISPLATIGREYKDHIKEFNLRWPTFTNNGVSWIPGLSFKYGWKY